MKPGNYDIPPVVRGDWWDGIPSIKIRVNGMPPVFPVVSARMQFRRGETLGCELTTDDGGIVIEFAAWWHFTIPGRVLPIAAGKWDYDFETTDSNGRVKTYISGKSVIIQDISR